jgi:tRNA (guanine-N7-)-methyltransferase
MSTLESRRPIRSYVLRQGRISAAQSRALESLMPIWGVPFRSEPLDWSRVFGRTAPRIVEIGSGMGETTAAIAAAHPRNDYLAIEVHTPGVGALLRQVAALGLSNLRIIQHDGKEVLTVMFGESSLDGIHVFFPDPWPKKRHHKRRLIQPDFARLMVSRLKSGGYLHLATDCQDYAQQMRLVLSADRRLRNTAVDFIPRPAARPATKFEQRGRALGHRVWDLMFVRRPAPAGIPEAGR